MKFPHNPWFSVACDKNCKRTKGSLPVINLACRCRHSMAPTELPGATGDKVLTGEVLTG